MPGHELPAAFRLKRRDDFQRVFAGRQAVADGVLRLHGCPGAMDHPRLGLSVSRRLGGAVVRNRYKRILREAFRLSRARLPALDMVVIPQPGRTPTLAEYQTALIALSLRLAKSLKRASG